MATTVTSESNYSGKEAGKIIGKAFKEAATIASGFITVNENVGHKLYLRKIQTTGGRREYTCSFEPGGSVNLNENVIEPKKFKDDWVVCKEDFRNQWNDGDLGASAHNDGDMKVIMDAIIADKLAKESAEVEDMLWSGSKANADEFDGFITQFEADNSVITVDGTEVDIDNVVAEITKAITAVPTAMKKKPIKVGLASNIATAYSMYLIGKGINAGFGGDANTDIKFGKFTLVELPGLPDNNIVITDPENLVFGTGLQQDFNEIRVVDTDETLLDGNIRGTMVYSGDTGYYYGDEIVWYRPDGAPSV